MIEIKGKYNSAKVFTDVIGDATVSQIIELCSQEFTVGQRIRMMPDVHAGACCVIGTTMTVSDKIVPNLVGYDIGCGMETVRIKERNIELIKLDKLIKSSIPSGFSLRSTPSAGSGKGDPDWNFSAPHGAGRLMSRGEAKASFTVSEFKKQMTGIYSTTVGKGTLDECPMAYKSIDDIIGNLGDSAEITEILKPIYNFKAGAEE